MPKGHEHISFVFSREKGTLSRRTAGCYGNLVISHVKLQINAEILFYSIEMGFSL